LAGNPPLEVMLLDSIEAVDRLVAHTVAAHGLSAYAGGMVTGPIAHSTRPFYFFNWPETWIRVYEQRGFLRKDPAARWAIGSGAPITWSELKAELPANDPGHEVFAEAILHGYSEGLVVPVRTGSGALGLVSSGGDRDRLLADETALLAAFFGAALIRAEELTGTSRPPTPSPLTLRERECTALMVQGLGDAQIGFALGISTETVRFHIDNARGRLGARSRAQLAAIVAGNALTSRNS
jgi:DNA-binding CsgD family transcriptional regulator